MSGFKGKSIDGLDLGWLEDIGGRGVGLAKEIRVGQEGMDA